jgi:hypothetical protein
LKKIITVLVLSVLILSAFAVVFAQNVKASDASGTEVKVLDYTWYTSTSSVNAGDLIVVGEIQNVGSKTIGNVTLTGNAFGSNGEALANIQAYPFAYDMLPGQKAPFYIDFPQSSGIQTQSTSGPAPNWVTSVSDVSVTVASVTDTSATQYADLQIPKGDSILFPPSTDFPEYRVVGNIENNGTETAEDIFVVVTFYNSTGAAVGMNYTGVANALAPGAQAPFDIPPIDPTDSNLLNITSYAVLIDSLTPGSGSSSVSPTSPTSQFPTLLVVAVVVVVVVVVLALMLLMKRKKQPAPPPPPPQSETPSEMPSETPQS